MIFYNKIEAFLIKRSVIITSILMVFSLIIFKTNKEIILGLVIGYLVSLIRLRILSSTVKNIIGNAVKQVKKRTPFEYIFVQVFTLAVLIYAIKSSVPFFFASFAGILIIPLTILINSLSELIGLTRNNFE